MSKTKMRLLWNTSTEQLLDSERLLRAIIASCGKTSDVGLCIAADLDDMDWHDKTTMFRAWPEFSGDVIFPVPYGVINPKTAFWRVERYSGEYGASRLRLADFVIKCIEDELDKRAEANEQWWPS